MTLITFLAIASLCCVFTVVAVGIFSSNQDTISVGFALLIIWIFALICFQAGAYWQRTNTNEKFTLTPKP